MAHHLLKNQLLLPSRSTKLTPEAQGEGGQVRAKGRVGGARKTPFPIHWDFSQTAPALQPVLINKGELEKGWGGFYSLPCSLFIFFIFIRRF